MEKKPIYDTYFSIEFGKDIFSSIRIYKSLKSRFYPDLTPEHKKEFQFAIRFQSRQFGDLLLGKYDLFNLILSPLDFG